MEQIKTFGTKWALIGGCKGGISLFLWGFSQPNRCSLRKKSENGSIIIFPFLLVLVSKAKCSLLTLRFSLTNPHFFHIPAEKHKTSGDNPSTENPRKEKNTVNVIVLPSNRDAEESYHAFYFTSNSMCRGMS